MSFTTVIKTVTGSLKLVASRIKPEQGVKLREARITVLPDPRFTKDQLENLKTRAGRTDHPDR